MATKKANKEVMNVSVELTSAQVSAPEVAQVKKVKVTQTTISKKQENKGAKGILDLTSQLSQVLKQFDGIYEKVLPECDGLTVEGWMAAHGVYRFVTKNGTKKGYTPALLMAGWHSQMKKQISNIKEDTKTKAFYYKNVPAKYQPELSEVEAWGLKDENVSFRVFTKEEAEKIDGKPISRYMKVEIEDNKWSVNTILKGLKQTNNFAKEQEKAAKCEKEWYEIEDLYIIRFDKQKDGKVVRVVVPVKKNLVTF